MSYEMQNGNLAQLLLLLSALLRFAGTVVGMRCAAQRYMQYHMIAY
jgi:hypothetical protein